MHNFIDEVGLPTVTGVFSDKTKIIFVGSLDTRKNPLLLVKSLYNLRKKNSFEFECKILGGGPLKKKLENKIKNLSMGSCIKLIGPVQNVYEYLSVSDIFVLPSESEGTPRAAMEALALGNFVIIRNTGNNADLISSSKTGLVFNYDDELEAKILEASRIISGKVKQNNLPKLFSQEKNGRAFIELCQQL